MLAERVYPVRDINCPVCNLALGYRRFDQAVSFYCRECDYFWKYLVKKKLPVGIKNEPPKAPPECGCGRCGR